LESLKSITVLGSSAASTFKSSDQSKSWPHLLERELSNFSEFQCKIVSGLTFVRSIPELSDIRKTNLLILHFGTAIGWPSSVVRKGIIWGINYTNEFGLHQSAYRSKSLPRRIKSFLKARLRNTIKYGLFFTGRYRARINRREVDDQVMAVINIAQQKSDRIIWIQHQALQHRSILVERLSYKRYYKESIRCLEKYRSSNLIVITLPDSFLVQENYLLDCVHLSDKGHQILNELILKQINTIMLR